MVEYGRVVDLARRYFDSDEELTIEEKEVLLGYGLIVPSIALVGIMILYPLLYNLFLSFHRVPLNPDQSIEWVGLSHYRNILSDPNFWQSLRLTIQYTLLSDVLATLGGLAVALLFNIKFKGRRLVRGLVLLPFVAPLISVAFVWRWIFDPVFGIFPYIFRDVLGLYSGTIDLLSNRHTAIWALITYDAWRHFPFAFLFILARLQAIPSEIYSAAEIDGAGKIAKFKDLTLPELKYAIATVFLLRWIWNFNKFAEVWLLTRHVETLPVYTYQTAFSNFEYGAASSVSLILLVFLMVFSVLYVSQFIDW